MASAFGVVQRSRDVNNQTTQAPVAVQLDTPDHCHYDLYKQHIGPGAVVSSSGLRRETPDWPSRGCSSVLRSSFSASSTARKSDAIVAHRGPSPSWDPESTIPQNDAPRPPLRGDPYRQTVPRRTLHGSGTGPSSNRVDPAPTAHIRRCHQGDVDSLTKSGRDECFDDGRSFQTSGRSDEVSTQARLDGRRVHFLDPVGGIPRQSDDVGTPRINHVHSEAVARQLADLTRRLAERDAELRTLRKTMEHNEMAMLKVTDDRRRAWQSELAGCRAQWERSVQDHRDRCERSEYLLRAEIARLERENASLRAGEERELELKTARDRVDRLTAELELKRAEICELRAVVDKRQTTDTHCACSVDTGSHQRALTSSDDDTTHAVATQPAAHLETVSTDSRHGELITSDDYRGNQTSSPGNITTSNEVDRLREEISFIINELCSARQQFDEERRRWTMEKERVITYQKYLQLNYVQMVRRTEALQVKRNQLITELAMAGGAPGQMTYFHESYC